MSNSIPTFTLSSGYQIPGVGLGCWLGAMGGGERAYEMCKKAIKVGYRAFDTAAGYGNEHGVGRAIKESGIPRSEFFVTTKLQNTHHDRVAEALDASLTALGLDYVDLYLIHWPQAQRGDETWGHNAVLPEESPTVAETWAQMEALLDTGRVRSIGVSNFSIRTLETLLLPHARVTPAVNQIELHPFLPQFELKEYLDRKGIHVTAYSSLGTGVSSEGSGVPSLLQNGTVQSLADKHGVTTGQVLLSWGVQRGASVIPKSESEDRLRKNFTLVKLSDEDMQTLNGLHKQPGQHRSLLHYHDGGLVFGWTYEQLGWNFTTDGQVSE